MRDFDFIKFNKNIQKDFESIKPSISYLENIEFENMHSGMVTYDNVDYLHKAILDNGLKNIKLKLIFAYEFLGLPNMLNTLEKELANYEDKYDKLEYLPFVDSHYSPVESILNRHLDALCSQFEENNNIDSSLKLLEQILKGTGKIVLDRELIPSNETEVKKVVYDMLIHVFPDTVREIPIPQISKTYRPDIGVKSLKSAIEYKFADSNEEVKKAIEGIFADVHGYGGSNDWNNFYAIIYMTSPFMTQTQVEEHFRISDVPTNWKPIIVYGKGERKVGKKNTNEK